MPSLHHMNLSHNRLQQPFRFEQTQLLNTKARSLVLNATGVTWDTLFSLLQALP
jgi:hypothetical protein